MSITVTTDYTCRCDTPAEYAWLRTHLPAAVEDIQEDPVDLTLRFSFSTTQTAEE